MNAISLKGRSVLGLQDFTAGEIERILEVAAQMKKIVLSDNFFNDTATTEIYTLSLHDALPISVLSSLPVNTWEPMLSILQRAAAR